MPMMSLFFVQIQLTILNCLHTLMRLFYAMVHMDCTYISLTHYCLLGKGGYVFGSVGLSVCLVVCLLSACGQHYSKSYELIGMKFYGGVLGSTMKNSLNFGGDLGILR